MSHVEHQRHSQGLVVRCAVVTLSDTRTEATDRSGATIRELLTAAGHAVGFHAVIPDDAGRLDALLTDLESRGDLDAILTSGGTGITARDATVPVISRHLVTELPGFGELFRMLSFEQIGAAAMLSRALGGVGRGGKLLFAMPGSTAAVELAMKRLILPELPHLLRELRRT